MKSISWFQRTREDFQLQKINWTLQINAPAGKSEYVFDNILSVVFFVVQQLV